MANQGLLHLSFSGCAPALLFDVKQRGCSEWINEALIYLEGDDSINNVLLGFRYSTFLYGDQLELYPGIPKIKPIVEFPIYSGNYLTGDDAREVYWKSFAEIVNRLLISGKNVYLIYPIPELPMHITNATSPFSVFEDKAVLNLTQSTSSEYYLSRNNFILNKLASLPYGDKLQAIKPFEILCGSEYCPAVSGK